MRMMPRINFTPKIDIPEDFILVQDNQEKLPKHARHKGLFNPSLLYIITAHLKTGDYSIQGFEDVITIERKSISDLLGTLGKGRIRFEKELNRMSEYKWKGLLIEGLENDVYQPNDFSSMHPNSIYHSLAAIETKWGLSVYYAKDKKSARNWVLSRLTKLYKYLRNGEL